ncbi:long-chain fatty acid--CoA ligase [Phenylobacterium sp. SCN 70-31]|uniref:class I adenylate-forming enzyme family protein n=1 Tax=Phenylobacterium sp. SCN 70-31 TaxID=1660129 RepID=UPI000868F332|nr:long-chain fatty acid--CoA ligase [Phenylobacterium sp. SCN 70-31]ODT88321.1 MAG: hypothetical protein ABS78_06770 [Phenylobacterium sp. SCN 70-31]
MVTLQDRFKGMLAVDPQAPAIEFRGSWLSWGDLADVAKGINEALQDIGVPTSQAVGCAIRNSGEHAAAIIAFLAGDHSLLTINPLFPDETLAADLAKLRPAVVIADGQDWDRAGFKAAVGAIGAAGLELTHDRAQPIRSVPGLERPTSGDRFEGDPDVAIYMLTSGTTGAPKRVAIGRARILANIKGALRYQKNPAAITDPPALRSAAVIVDNPLVHMSGIWGLLNAIAGGFRVCLLEKFNVDEWRSAVARHRPKIANLTPSSLRMVLDAGVTREELSSLTALKSGTAALSPDLIDEALDRWGVPVLQTYGATEFTNVAGWSVGEFREHYATHKGAVGIVNPDYEARIVDAQSGEPVPFGTEGVLELRGAHVAGDQWLRTTDRAVLDADRFLWIKGRVDNVIIRGGFKVHGEDVQRTLEQHPSVREACVVGVPDERLGNVPVAAVVLQAGADLTEEGLKAWAREQLLPYQVPTAFRFVADLPRTQSMKPMLPAVRELFAAPRATQSEDSSR